MPLVTLSELKRALGLPLDQTTSDTALTEAEARAAAWVEKMTHRRFGPPEERTEYMVGLSGRILYLSGVVTGLPDAAASVVLAERLPRLSLEWDIVDPDEYEVRERSIVRMGVCPFVPAAEYRVTYPDGFAAVPGDIRELVIELVAGMRSRSTGSSGVVAETIGDYSYRLDPSAVITAGQVSAAGQATINRWRPVLI